jgi:hypothetical protein
MTNKIKAAASTRRVWLWMPVCVVVFVAAFVSQASLAGQDAKPKYNVTGKWEGKFSVSEENPVADVENPVAVEVSVKDDAGKLSGTAVFYVIRNKDNNPQVVGSAESELIDPQFDGNTLKFSVKNKGPQSGRETRTEMRMKLTSATEAELENLEDNSTPSFKMKKVQ